MYLLHSQYIQYTAVYTTFQWGISHKALKAILNVDATKFGQFAWKLLRFSIFKMKMPTIQTCDDYLEDVLSFDTTQEAVADGSLNSSNMFDFLLKEEHTGKDDLKALQKDRQKKDNHNKSKFFNWLLKNLKKFLLI